jgi:transcriptional regulator with XRE-family HTH domain
MNTAISVSSSKQRSECKNIDNTRMSIGQRVRMRRHELNITQVDLSRTSGITQSSLSNIETDSTKSLRGMTLIGLARGLKTSTRWIMSGKGPHEPEPQLSAQEEHLIQVFLDLSDTNRMALLAAAEAMQKSQE